jgi:hypothetical protein
MFRVCKFFVFAGLLIAVIVQYAIDIYSKFNKNATTFTSRTIETQNFTMPPITICMDNGLKPSVLNKYGMESIFDFNFNMLESNLTSVWDTYVEASYLLERDIQITGQFFHFLFFFSFNERV